MTSENGLPTCVRFKDLQARGIVGSWAALQDLIKNQSLSSRTASRPIFTNLDH